VNFVVLDYLIFVKNPDFKFVNIMNSIPFSYSCQLIFKKEKQFCALAQFLRPEMHD